jgi:maltooligosyltrehalose trehalohydrolase
MMMNPFAFDLGAEFHAPSTVHFRVWAPLVKQVTLRLLGPPERHLPMNRDEHGYHILRVDDLKPGGRYFYNLDGRCDRPDPASRYQPETVHGPSEVVDLSFPWTDQSWHGIPLGEYVIYELHIGTFTPEGTFDSAIGQLDRLRDLGVTAVEVMPIAQFPGTRNWGYDGVGLFAVQNSYGGPWALARFVDACHARRMAVILDVVYNHVGPEGNYLREFGPYFTDRHKVPWGDAVNFDGHFSDEVRRFYISNALFWQRHFHLDGLRLDAVPCILDTTVFHVLAELSDSTGRAARALNRPFHLIAESDLNDPRLTRAVEQGGYGLSAAWADDFHHALHALFTGERFGYYADFGGLTQLARAFRDGFVYTGQHSVFRGRRHGASVRGLLPEHFVVCTQNHDQIGNRAQGNRLTSMLDFESLKLAAGLMLLSRFVPMLFMGEEYAETAPFQYFTSHNDSRLAEAVRRGRRKEFAAFAWQGEVPDPQDEATFQRSKLRLEAARSGRGQVMVEFYRELLRIRREHPASPPRCPDPPTVDIDEASGTLFAHYRCCHGAEMIVVFQTATQEVRRRWPIPVGQWSRLIDSSAERWQGPGSTTPERLESHGEAELHLPGRSFVAYWRQR